MTKGEETIVQAIDKENYELRQELAEAKRLLKLAVTAMNNGSCTANCYKCKHKENCDYSHRFEWEHTEEAAKLLKED